MKFSCEAHQGGKFLHEIRAVTERNISEDDLYLHILYIVLWNNLSSVEIQTCYQLFDRGHYSHAQQLYFLSVCSAIFDITKTTPF